MRLHGAAHARAFSRKKREIYHTKHRAVARCAVAVAIKGINAPPPFLAAQNRKPVTAPLSTVRQLRSRSLAALAALEALLVPRDQVAQPHHLDRPLASRLREELVRLSHTAPVKRVTSQGGRAPTGSRGGRRQARRVSVCSRPRLMASATVTDNARGRRCLQLYAVYDRRELLMRAKSPLPRTDSASLRCGRSGALACDVCSCPSFAPRRR